MTSREEVAKKLRKSGEYMGDFKKDHYYGFYQIAEDIGLNEDNFFDEWELIRAKCNRLADLIDPTCHLALDEELSQELQGEMFRCSKCDAAFPRINGEYRYCPNCGARVVSDEA